MIDGAQRSGNLPAPRGSKRGDLDTLPFAHLPQPCQLVFLSHTGDLEGVQAPSVLEPRFQRFPLPASAVDCGLQAGRQLMFKLRISPAKLSEKPFLLDQEINGLVIAVTVRNSRWHYK